jgi:hypothetical protein
MTTHFLKKVSLSLFVFLGHLSAKAEFTNNKCADVLTASGEIQINRQWDIEKGLCFIDIHPRNPVDSKYRDYYFDNTGNFMVFNSYGNGAPSQTTAARDFYLFPITEDYPDYSIEENGDVVVKMVSGHQIKFSAKDFSIQSLTPGSVSEKPLSETNKGGVEFNLKSGFWIDGGFKKGASPFSSPTAKSVIHSAQSLKSCTLTNKEFLTYQNKYDFIMTYQKEKLVNFLKLKCPQLQF